MSSKPKYAFVPMDDSIEPPKTSKTTSKRERKEKKHRRRDQSKERGRDNRSGYRKRKGDGDYDARWGDQEPDSEEEAAPSPRSPKRVKVHHDPDGEDRPPPANEVDEEEEAARRDILERDALAERLRDKDMGKKKDKDRRRESERDSKLDIADLRLMSRQKYLEKRNPEQLALLRRQVEEETAELESGVKLSRAEVAQFAKNREVLRLAEELAQVDSHEDGYVIPEDYITEKGKIDKKRKHDALYKRYAEKDDFVTEHEAWDREAAKATATGAKISSRGERSTDGYTFVQEDAEELLFSKSDFIKWQLDSKLAGEGKLSADQQFLAAQLDAAEKRRVSIQETRKSLPIYAYREEFLKAMEDYQVLIIVGETGSGKTTQLTQYLAEAGFTKNGKIGCTQPRRVAAMSVAKRVAEEMEVKVGQEVGYSVRFEDNTTKEGSHKTIIQYMTDGMLLRETMNDPLLSNYAAIMIDEAHERTVQSDILLALLRDLSRARPELKLLISSATLDAQRFSQFFDDSPILNVPGRRYPVDIYYTSQPEADPVTAALTTIFQIHLSQDEKGDILVFLTGQEEIEQLAERLADTAKKLGNRMRKELIIAPIYANLPQDQQAKIFDITPDGARKVVLSTNIAETSLTVDGIVFVIDTGYVKENVFNPASGVSSLVTVPCSRASANQRAGRAGRVGPGKCFRLYTRYSLESEMLASAIPEIQRCNLASVVLLLSAIGVSNLLEFSWLDPPSNESLISALNLLYALQAFNHKGQLTKIGRQLAEFPTSPNQAKAILAAEKEGVVEEVLSIVSILGEVSSLYYRPKDKKVMADSAHQRLRVPHGGDHLTLLNIYSQWVDSGYSSIWARENFLDDRSLKRARDVREQLAKLCDRVEVPLSTNPNDVAGIKRAILAGYFHHCAKMQRNGDGYRVLKGNSSVVYPHPSSVVFQLEPPPRLVLYHELVLTSKEYMRSVCPIEPELMAQVAPHYFNAKEIDDLKDRKFKSGRHAARG